MHLGVTVTGIYVKKDEIKGVNTTEGLISSDVVINAAGLYADEISRMAGINSFTITPRRGEYWLFDNTVEKTPRRVLFPTPSKVSKGVVVTTEVSGHLMIGPNAQNLSPEEKDNTANTINGLNEVWHKASEIWPHLPSKIKAIRTFAGLRPEPSGGDFIIRNEVVNGFINVAGIRSPGLTSAPAIAEEVLDILSRIGIELKEKDHWNPKRKEITHFFMLSPERINNLIMKNEAYGKIVCRCNNVSEGDVLEAINRMKFIGVKIPAVDSVKFRTKVTTGTCQGSFCRPRIVKLLAEQYQIPMWKVTQNGKGSEIGIGDVKILLRGDVN